jgi:2-polyprenyl-3-methyl-5-hydroxy-6-metoxy-1,4-benzoquinol methylase
MSEKFNSDYYERGVELGISGYTNYHWRPEYVMGFANEIKNRYYLSPLSTFLDYGCAKGYLVKGLRLLGVDCYGYDISEYAINNADESVKKYLTNSLEGTELNKFNAREFTVTIAKDTLEHVPKDELQKVLQDIKGLTGVFRIREYELDKTHVIKEDEQWWIEQFNKAGLSVEEFYYDFPHAKDHWLKVHPFGNGTFILKVRN